MGSRNDVFVSSSTSGRGRTCLCSPSSHPGSFRCSLHRSSGSPSRIANPKAGMKRVVGPSVKALVLMKLMKPSSHHLQRRRNFHPKPTRFYNIHNHCMLSWLLLSFTTSLSLIFFLLFFNYFFFCIYFCNMGSFDFLFLVLSSWPLQS